MRSLGRCARALLGVVVVMALVHAGCGARFGEEPPKCVASFRDCDGDPSNGCETDVSFSNEACGSCGARCTSGLVCANGACRAPEDVVQIAAGADFSCARRASGEVLCWGANDEAQLGDGTRVDRASPAPVRGIDDAVSLSALGVHACVRRRDLSVWCWGGNYNGELGNGTTDLPDVPVEATLLRDAAQLTTYAVTCYLRRDGAVLCTGLNACGAAGGRSALPVAELDLVLAWPQATAVAGLCVLEEGGSVVCWGSNVHGEHGNGRVSDCPKDIAPSRVPGISGMTRIFHGLPGGACALSDEGALFCWGSNDHQKLTKGGEPLVSPQRVEGLPPIEKVAIGLAHACFLTSDRHVYCRGLKRDDAFPDRAGLRGGGDPFGHDYSPEQATIVPGLEDIVDLSAAGWHTCALRRDGQIWCWGWNGRGQIGVGRPGDPMFAAVPTRVPL